MDPTSEFRPVAVPATCLSVLRSAGALAPMIDADDPARLRELWG